MKFSKRYAFILLIIFLSGFYLKYIYDYQRYKNDLYVFADFSAEPTLLQMTEFIKSPYRPQKLIAWNTHKDIKKYVNLKQYNATELTYLSNPLDGNYYYLIAQLTRELRREIKKNPNIQITLHTNLHHIEMLLPNLERIIPQKNIKRIHLYENSYADTTVGQKDKILTHNFSKGCPKDRKNKAFAYFTHEKHKTTYHLSFTKELKKNPKFRGLSAILSNATVEDVNLKKIAKSLSKSDKRKLAELLQINPQEFRDAYKNSDRKSAFLIAPPPLSGKGEKTQAFILSELIQANKYQWFFRPHSNLKTDTITQILQKEHPNLKVISSETPIEAFLLLDILPDYIGGYGTSSFLTLDKELFLFYIRHPNDPYLPYLSEHGILNKSQTLKLISP